MSNDAEIVMNNILDKKSNVSNWLSNYFNDLVKEKNLHLLHLVKLNSDSDVKKLIKLINNETHNNNVTNIDASAIILITCKLGIPANMKEVINNIPKLISYYKKIRISNIICILNHLTTHITLSTRDVDIALEKIRYTNDEHTWINNLLNKKYEFTPNQEKKIKIKNLKYEKIILTDELKNSTITETELEFFFKYKKEDEIYKNSELIVKNIKNGNIVITKNMIFDIITKFDHINLIFLKNSGYIFSMDEIMYIIIKFEKNHMLNSLNFNDIFKIAVNSKINIKDLVCCILVATSTTLIYSKLESLSYNFDKHFLLRVAILHKDIKFIENICDGKFSPSKYDIMFLFACKFEDLKYSYYTAESDCDKKKFFYENAFDVFIKNGLIITNDIYEMLVLCRISKIYDHICSLTQEEKNTIRNKMASLTLYTNSIGDFGTFSDSFVLTKKMKAKYKYINYVRLDVFGFTENILRDNYNFENIDKDIINIIFNTGKMNLIEYIKIRSSVVKPSTSSVLFMGNEKEKYINCRLYFPELLNNTLTRDENSNIERIFETHIEKSEKPINNNKINNESISDFSDEKIIKKTSKKNKPK